MMPLKTIQTSYFLRAIAILLVVANHSSTLKIGGGMNFLLMLAGFNLALFSFDKTTKQFASDLLSMVSRIVIPAYCIILFYAFFYWRFDVNELMLISNWVNQSAARVAEIPVWYVQVLAQMSVVIILLFITINAYDLFKKNIFVTCLIVLLLAVAPLGLLPNDGYPWGRLPYFYIWNFVLGWFVWCGIQRGDKTTLMLVSCVSSCVILFAFKNNLTGDSSQLFRVIFLLISVNLLIWVKEIRIPSVGIWLVKLTAKSTLTIFLLHLSYIAIYNHLFLLGDYQLDSMLRFIFTCVMCIASWLLFTSLKTTIKKLKKANPD